MNSDPTTPTLVRALGPLMGTAVVVGTVIGSGVFKKPQQVALHVPDFGTAALVWILGGALAILGALAYAEVAVLYPKAGGNYIFLREGYGRLAGFLSAWVEFWIIRGGSIAALATIFAESAHDMLRNAAFQQLTDLSLGPEPLSFWGQRLLTISVIIVLTLVNVRGVRWGGVLQLVITLVKVGSLLAIMLLPFVVTAAIAPSPTSHSSAPELPAATTIGGFLTALLAVLWAYHGWMSITPVAEEVKDPQRNIPLALFAGVGIVIVLYLGANLAYAQVIPRHEMAQMKQHSPQELAELRQAGWDEAAHDRTVAIGFIRRMLGPIGGAVAAVMVMCSVFGALNGNLLAGPRVLYAVSEDRLAPRWLARIHPRWHTPAASILLLGGWVTVLVLAVAVMTQARVLPHNKPHFDILTDFAMFGATIFETLAVASIFVFRRRRPTAERAYRCWGYPIVPALYVLILAAVVLNMFLHQTREAIIGVGFIGIGAVVYYVMVRTQAVIDSE